MNDLNFVVTIAVLATLYVSAIHLLMKYLSISQTTNQANQVD